VSRLAATNAIGNAVGLTRRILSMRPTSGALSC
jgi:hypothetical protein